MAINFVGDSNFRKAQATINENFITLHESATKIDTLTTSALLILDERIDIIMDELFDRIWEDLEQTWTVLAVEEGLHS